jgi:predicted DNA-binding antitoxin AbrB/MazE fold protein
VSNNSRSDEKKYTPRFAKSPEELVFYTDTREDDYPVYLLPTFEVRLKKRPTDVEKFAVFHLKSIEAIEKCDPTRDAITEYLADAGKNMTVDDYIASYPQLPLKSVIQAIHDLSAGLHIRTYKLVYEVYKGDYDEFVAETSATVVMLYIVPPYGLRSTTTDQKFAITYTTLKRLLSKLPPDVSSAVQRIAYVDKISTHRFILPVVKLKFSIPEESFARAFEEVKLWLEKVEETVPEEEKPEPQIEIELPEVPEVKPRELEIEVTQSTPVEQPKEQPQKSELVKLYLLSMRLPSKYLVQKIEIKEGEEVRKWEGIAKDIASRLEGIRRKAYDEISRIFAHIEEFGTWIAVSEKAVEEARKLSEWIRNELSSLPLNQVKKNIDLNNLYSVRAVPIYLEPDDAKELLSVAVARLSADVEELANRIKEAEEQQKKSALKRLENDLQYKKALLEAFRRFLSSI